MIEISGFRQYLLNFMLTQRVFLSLMTISFLIACTSHVKQEHELSVGWVLTEGLCEPETVLVDPLTNDLIVSNICGFKANGDGYLSKVSRSGEITSRDFVTGLNAPAGMAVFDSHLYVTDLDRIRQVSLENGEIVGEYVPATPGKAFNDIAIDDAGNIYVSDSARHQVLRRRAHDGVFEQFPRDQSHFQYANGLHVRGDTLFVGGEKLWQVDLNSRTVNELNIGDRSDIDGIEEDGASGLLLSIVGGPLFHLNNKGDTITYVAPGLSSTNHAFDSVNGKIYMPTGYDNTVIELDWEHP